MFKLLQILDTGMPWPEPYGWFHLISLALTALIIFFVCRNAKNHKEKTVINAVLITSIVVMVLEVYKQINYTYRVDSGELLINYQWYAFPWQFCSTPMYIGLLAGLIRKGKVHDSLSAYLATYSVFAGLAVMFYPVNIYVDTIGINIQTTVCHCSMIIIGAYLYASGHVKLEHKTVLKALPVFAATIGIAMILNEVAEHMPFIPDNSFNMFYISPYCDGSLPLYSLVQQVLPYGVCIVIYIAGFTLAAYVMLLIAMGADKLFGKKKAAV